MRLVNRITGIEGVGPNASPRVNLPVNRRYHGLKFFVRAGGVPVDPTTVINRVRCYVNGTTQRDLTAQHVLDIAALNGFPANVAGGEFPLQFSEPWRADKIDEQILAWDLFGESTFQVELVLSATADPFISGLAIFDYGQTLVDGRPLKNIVRQVEISKAGVAGQNDFDNIPIRDPIQRIMLDSTAAINSAEVTADRNKVFEATLAENARILADYGLNAAPFAYPILFDFTEQVIGDALIVGRDLNVRFDLAEAAQVFALVESRAPSF